LEIAEELEAALEQFAGHRRGLEALIGRCEPRTDNNCQMNPFREV
jgi:hypothetical protein